MIIEDDIQHSTHVTNAVDTPDPEVMNVNKNQRKEYYKGRRCEHCHYTGHTKDNNNNNIPGESHK